MSQTNNIQQQQRKKQEEISYLRKNADNYLKEHRIVELFEDLATKLCYQQVPVAEMDQFVINELKIKQEHGFSTGVFTDQEIENVFNLFDLKNEKQITKKACTEALKVLATSQYQWDSIEYNSVQIPERVNLSTFRNLCDSIAGIKDQNENK